MEPIETSYVREQALNLAVQFVQTKPRYSPDQVIDVANQFLNWLTNTEGLIDG